MLGKPLALVLREDHLIIDDDVEDAIATLNQRRVDAERFLDAGRQTGGLGTVLSPPAVGNRDLQDILLVSERDPISSRSTETSV